MEAIWKYRLNIGPQTITSLYLPKKAKLLTVQLQNGIPQLWAVVKSLDGTDVDRRITCYGTGIDVTNGIQGSYIGTVQDEDGFVWHFFDNGETN